MKFTELNLSQDILSAVEKAGFVEPSPIQEMTIPLALEGKDVIGQAQTGTGKTAAFGLPTLNKIHTEDNTIQALIIAPTRELAVQSQEELFRFGRDKGVRSALFMVGQVLKNKSRHYVQEHTLLLELQVDYLI